MTTPSNPTNPACFLYGAGQAKIEDSPYPTIKDQNHVILRIAYVGVCGSDVSLSLHIS
jgi:D-xylulose reductase